MCGKTASLGEVGGERAPALPFKALGVVRRGRCQQALRVGMPAHQDSGVILKTLADWEIDADRDHQPGKVGGRADARKESSCGEL